MRLVEVFMWNDASAFSFHEVNGEIVCAHIPARHRRLGFCPADALQLALLADVDEATAAEALASPGTPIPAGEIYEGDVSTMQYLVVYDCENLNFLDI